MGAAAFAALPANYIGVLGDDIKNSPTGVGMHDFNADGLMDLLLTNLTNDPTGALWVDALRLDDDRMHTYVTVPADIDNDGDLALLCSGPRIFFAHNSLSHETGRVRAYRNDSTPGSIVFTNVTATSGVDFLNDNTALGTILAGVYPVVLPGVIVL